MSKARSFFFVRSEREPVAINGQIAPHCPRRYFCAREMRLIISLKKKKLNTLLFLRCEATSGVGG